MPGNEVAGARAFPSTTWERGGGVTNYLKRWIDPAVSQPEITNLSLSHGFLALALYLVSLNVGMYLGESSAHSHGAILMEPFST